MNLVEKYIEQVKEAYVGRAGQAEKWTKFEEIVYGASDADIAKLLQKYPDTPQSLIEMLRKIDGTYHREYGGKVACVYFFGSVDGYPHYLRSAGQIVTEIDANLSNFVKEVINWNILEQEKYASVDDKITDDYANLDWLHLTDCMNNGGSSQFYIDFSPSEKGTYGQIISFVHDPDEFTVIADSFDQFLAMLLEGGLKFIGEDDTISLQER